MVMIVDEFEELFKKIANAIFPLKSDQLTLLNNFSALRGIHVHYHNVDIIMISC